MRLRSWLCAPAHGPSLARKAAEVGADIALFDLEDSVPPDRKAAARAALAAHYQVAPTVPTAVRINSLASADGLRDLLFLLDQGIAPAAVMLPKAVLPYDVDLVCSLFRERGAGPVRVFAIIETVRSLWALRALTHAPAGLCGLVFGAADFAVDLGVPPLMDDLRFVKQEIALAARRFEVLAIDSPCFQLRCGEQLETEIRDALRLGFRGKIAIHPDQIAPINSAFSHSQRSVEDAQRLVDLCDAAPDRAILRVEDQMVGPPFVKYARQVLAAAEGDPRG